MCLTRPRVHAPRWPHLWVRPKLQAAPTLRKWSWLARKSLVVSRSQTLTRLSLSDMFWLSGLSCLGNYGHPPKQNKQQSSPASTWKDTIACEALSSVAEWGGERESSLTFWSHRGHSTTSKRKDGVYIGFFISTYQRMCILWTTYGI